MDDVKVKISNDQKNADWCKVVWSQGLIEHFPYFVDRGALQEMGDGVRAALGDLVKKAMVEGVDACGPELKQVASAGRLLHVLFLGHA